MITLRHTDDAVIVEFWLLGTHLGPLMGIPPTGKSFRARVMVFFIFEDTNLVCERIYFDRQTIMEQLLKGAGPLSWLRALMALHRQRS